MKQQTRIQQVLTTIFLTVMCSASAMAIEHGTEAEAQEMVKKPSR